MPDPPSPPARSRVCPPVCPSSSPVLREQMERLTSFAYLVPKVRGSFVVMHPFPFWRRFFFFVALQFNHISPVVNKEAIKVMQNPCLNVLGQQSQGAESMAQVILHVSPAELWSILNRWRLLCHSISHLLCSEAALRSRFDQKCNGKVTAAVILPGGLVCSVLLSEELPSLEETGDFGGI